MKLVRWMVALMLCGCEFPRSAPVRPSVVAQRTMDQGVLQLRQGRLEDAAASFRVARELGAEAPGLDGLGCVAFLQGEYDLAEHLFREASQFDPEYIAASANLALLYDVLGHWDDARRLYESVIRRDPVNFRSRNNLGVLMVREGERAKGLDTLREAQTLLPGGITEDNIKKVGP